MIGEIIIAIGFFFAILLAFKIYDVVEAYLDYLQRSLENKEKK